MARRKHRRVRPHWEGCGCPSGAQMVSQFAKPHPQARGFLCIAPTQRGPRFVRASCEQGRQRESEPVPPAFMRRLPAPMREQLLMLPAPREEKKPRKPRKARLDWSKCKCPAGSEQRVNKRGITFCWQKKEKGGVIVAADCK